jgi:purine-cytosine permease-like protein
VRPPFIPLSGLAFSTYQGVSVAHLHANRRQFKHESARARVMRLWGAPFLINFIRPAIFAAAAAVHPTAAQRHETLSLSQNAKHTPAAPQ